MRTGSLRALLGAALLTLAVAGPAAGRAEALPGAAKPPAPSTSTTVAASTTTTVPVEPKAYIVIDADTGAVVAAKNDRTPLPPASLTKVLTAVTAAPLLDRSGRITISARAEAQPANKVGAKAGEEWPAEDAMNVMLLQSSNDLAMALAENVGGSAEAFQAVMAQAAQRLGMADQPVLRDPAGLDGDQGVDGGNLVSARDLAIAARALVADPWLGPIVAKPRFAFTAPDGVAHDAVNHNKLVLDGGYPGSIGVKTGFTRRAGRSLIGAARRDGRTMIAVVLNVPDTYGWVKTLLDAGFASSPASQRALPRLGPLVRLSAKDLVVPRPPATAAPVPLPAAAPVVASAAEGSPPAAPDHVAALPSTNVAATARAGEPREMLVFALGGAAVVLLSAGLASARRRLRDDYRVRPRHRRID